MRKLNKKLQVVNIDDICATITSETGIHKELSLHILETYLSIVANEVNKGNEIHFDGIGTLKIDETYKRGEVIDIRDKFYYKYSKDKITLTSDNTLIGLLNPNEDLGKPINERTKTYIKQEPKKLAERNKKLAKFKDQHKKECIKRVLIDIGRSYKK